MSEDPLIVRLKFEPSGRPESEKDYYLLDKQNMCVVCGRTDSYIKKHVVPHEYRRYDIYIHSIHYVNKILDILKIWQK